MSTVSNHKRKLHGNLSIQQTSTIRGIKRKRLGQPKTKRSLPTVDEIVAWLNDKNNVDRIVNKPVNAVCQSALTMKGWCLLSKGISILDSHLVQALNRTDFALDSQDRSYTIVARKRKPLSKAELKKWLSTQIVYDTTQEHISKLISRIEHDTGAFLPLCKQGVENSKLLLDMIRDTGHLVNKRGFIQKNPNRQ